MLDKSIVALVTQNADYLKCRKAHKLHGKQKDLWELHIESSNNNWLLIYRIEEDTLYLVNTGTHDMVLENIGDVMEKDKLKICQGDVEKGIKFFNKGMTAQTNSTTNNSEGEQGQMTEEQKVYNIREELLRLDLQGEDIGDLSSLYESVCPMLTSEEKKSILKEAIKDNKLTIRRILARKLKECNNISEESTTAVIDNVGYQADEVNGKYREGNTFFAKGTVYSHDDDESEYEDDFKFTYNPETKELRITEISPVFTKSELNQIMDILQDNIETNLGKVDDVVEEYTPIIKLESTTDGFGKEIKIGDKIVAIDFYKDITVSTITSITQEYGGIVMVHFKESDKAYETSLINTAVYKFDSNYGYIYGYSDSKLQPRFVESRSDVFNAFGSFNEWASDMFGQGGTKIFKAFDKNGTIIVDDSAE